MSRRRPRFCRQLWGINSKLRRRQRWLLKFWPREMQPWPRWAWPPDKRGRGPTPRRPRVDPLTSIVPHPQSRCHQSVARAASSVRGRRQPRAQPRPATPNLDLLPFE